MCDQIFIEFWYWFIDFSNKVKEWFPELVKISLLENNKVLRNFWRKQKNDVRGTLRTLFVEPLTDSATPMKYCKNVIFWLDFMVHLFLLKEPYLPFIWHCLSVAARSIIKKTPMPVWCNLYIILLTFSFIAWNGCQLLIAQVFP